MPVSFSVFRSYPDLLYGFSERLDGPMKVKNSATLYTERRSSYFETFKISLNHVVSAYLLHGSSSTLVAQQDGGQLIPETDGLFTAETGLFLSITAADCFPIYLFDPIQRVTAIAHAGWRGVVQGILPKLIQQLLQQFQCKPSDLLIGIGPGLRGCHFQIQSDIREQFDDQFVTEREGKIFVDLPQLISHQLIEQGIDPMHLEDAHRCTHCLSHQYFSYRRDQPQEVEAQLAFIGLRTT